VNELILPLTTVVATQAATTDATEAVVGTVYAIEYRPGTIATGATLTVTCIGLDGAEKPLLTKASAGTADSWYYPRDLVHAVADAVALTGTAGGDRACPILQGKIRAVIASGGTVTVRTGTVVIYWEPL